MRYALWWLTDGDTESVVFVEAPDRHTARIVVENDRNRSGMCLSVRDPDDLRKLASLLETEPPDYEVPSAKPTAGDERRDERVRMGTAVAPSLPRPPCECGETDAYWHSADPRADVFSARIYCCDDCFPMLSQHLRGPND